MKYLILYKIIILALLISAILMPWITISFTEKTEYTVFDLAKTIKEPYESKLEFNFPNIIKIYEKSNIALILSLILYFISIPITLMNLKTKSPNKFLLIIGIITILSGSLFVYSVESFKTNFAYDAANAGGIVGEEFKGKEHIIINNLVHIGNPYKFIIIAGTISILLYLWKPKTNY